MEHEKKELLKMCEGITVLSLFDGMSCGQIALERAGIKVKQYFASEIDKYAIQVAMANFPDIIQLGDVRNIKSCDLPKIDLLIGGLPCQDLSKSQNGNGLNGQQSILFYEYLRIYQELKPTYFLLENVDTNKTNPINEYFGNPYRICSDLFVPQNRTRRYWTNIKINKLPIRPNWNYEYGQQVRRDVKGVRPMKNGTASTLLKAMGAGGGNMPMIKENNEWRKLTINELEQLQGLPIDYTKVVSNSQRKIMLGNGWTVDIISHILNFIV
ncbi:MAG: DNA (cytosine-5-)-methyltransferase [bacterium]|nr:DNA (cytosine-5-)-methyltransferase [bacterium]